MKKDLEQIGEAFRQVAFEFALAVGIIWLIKMTPFLEPKDWVKERMKKRNL
jgi:hypothetical protein